MRERWYRAVSITTPIHSVRVLGSGLSFHKVYPERESIGVRSFISQSIPRSALAFRHKAISFNA